MTKEEKVEEENKEPNSRPTPVKNVTSKSKVPSTSKKPSIVPRETKSSQLLKRKNKLSKNENEGKYLKNLIDHIIFYR